MSQKKQKFKIKRLFELDLKNCINSFLLFCLVTFYALFQQVVMNDVDKFKESLILLVESNIYIAVTFISFWMLMYVFILVTFFKPQINDGFALMLLMSVLIYIKGSYLIFAALIIIIIGFIIKVQNKLNEKNKIKKTTKVSKA